MGIVKEITQLTGLSQARLATWLGVSKSLLQFSEKGERSLPAAVSAKLHSIFQQLMKVKDAGKAKKPGKSPAMNPKKMASGHKRKMEFHQQKAQVLSRKLKKLKALHPQLQLRLALLDSMKDHNTKAYKATARDREWIEMIEWFSKDRMPSAGLEEQELLQDKIDMHKGYAEVHKKRWDKLSKKAPVL